MGKDYSFLVLWLSLVSHLNSVQIGRSAGFSLGGSYAPHRQLQQQPGGVMPSGSMGSGNASDLQHLHANVGDSFSSSHGLSASYHSQVLSVSIRKFSLTCIKYV